MILFQILLMKAQGDRKRLVPPLEFCYHLLEPSSCRIFRGGNDKVRRFISQIPSPDSGMSLEGSRRFTDQKFLSLPNLPIGVQISTRTPSNLSHRKDGKPLLPTTRLNHPGGKPIQAAHMAGKEGGKKADFCIISRIGYADEVIQSLYRDPANFRLEIFPHDKDPHDFEPILSQEREISLDSRSIESVPPVHGRFSRPVVYASEKVIRILNHKRLSGSIRS